MGNGQSLRHTFYWVERIGDTRSSLDYLNRAILDPTQTSNAVLLAAEIQAKMNAASVLGGGYTATYAEDNGTMTITLAQTSGTVNSFWPVDDDLLQNEAIQQLFSTVST